MMNLARVYVVVLMAGWFTWLAIDKPQPGQRASMPPPGAAPYALPLPERPTVNPIPMPPPEGDWVADLQYAAEMFKQGEYRRGYLEAWRRQYWLVAAIVSVTLIAVFPPLRTLYRRRHQAHADGSGQHTKVQ